MLPYTNRMGYFFDVVWVVSSITKSIRDVSYSALIIGFEKYGAPINSLNYASLLPIETCNQVS